MGTESSKMELKVGTEQLPVNKREMCHFTVNKPILTEVIKIELYLR